MNIILKKLNLQGSDIKGAVERFMGDEELYLECLNQFAKDENFVELRESLENNNYEQAFNNAHSLKGVAGNLGLTPLYAALSEIVESLRHGDYTDLKRQYHAVSSEETAFLHLLGN